MPDARPPVLFLSHPGADLDRAVALARQIEAIPTAKEAGLHVWVDQRPDGPARLMPGRPWADQLEEAIQTATAFAVLVTSQGVRNWVRMEIRVALSHVINEQREGQAYPFIPLIDGGSFSDLPPFARLYHGIRLDESGEGLLSLVEAVLGRALTEEPQALIGEPFRGLEAFEAEHAALFFGREKETQELIQRLRGTELILVTGDSGAGKSSLVKAGLVPAWREGLLADPLSPRPDSRLWHAIEMRPGNNPFEGLLQGAIHAGREAGIANSILLDIGDREHGIRSENPDRVFDALVLARPKGSRLLLVVDQLEELWTSVPDGQQRNRFLDVLLALVSPAAEHRVVATMRRDFVHLHSDHDGLKARLLSHPQTRFVLGGISASGLEDVVVKPLHLAGVRGGDSQGLAAAIAQDAQDEPGNLALVQMALFETWQRRGKHGSLLEAYNAIGRLEGALATAAADVFWNPKDYPEWLGDEERGHAEALFMRMAWLGDRGGATRRVVRLEELDEATREVATKLSTRACRRLLVARGMDAAVGTDGNTIELAHEQLLTQWSDYRHWLWGTATSRFPKFDRQREPDKRLLDRLMDRSALWVAHGRNETDFARGIELEELSGLLSRRGKWLSATERAYIEASKEAQATHEAQQRAELEREREYLKTIEDEQKQRAETQRRAVVLIVLLTLLFTTAVLFVAGRGFRNLHRERSEILMATATILADQGQYDRALRVALLGSRGDWFRPKHPDANGLIGAIAYQLSLEAILELPGTMIDAASFFPDGRRVLTGARDGTVQIWEQDSQGRWGSNQLEGHAAEVETLSFSADGKRFLTSSADKTVRIWDEDTEGGWHSISLSGHQGKIIKASFFPDGRSIFTSSVDNTARIWRQDPVGRWTATTLEGQMAWFGDVSISVDGQRVLTRSGDNRARIWRQDEYGRWLGTTLDGHLDRRFALGFLPRGQVLTSFGDGTNQVWSEDAKGNWSAAVIEPVGVAVATRSSAKGLEILTTTATGHSKVWLQGSSGGWTFDLLRGGWIEKAIFSAGDDRILAISGSRALIWERARNDEWTPRLLEGQNGEIKFADFSPDRARVLTVASDGTVRIWREIVRVGSPAISVGGQSGIAASSDFSADGRYAITGIGKTVQIWRANEIGHWVLDHTKEHNSVVKIARFAKKGRCSVAVFDDGTIWTWQQSVEGGWVATQLEDHKDGVQIARCSFNGERILTGSNEYKTVRVWEKITDGGWKSSLVTDKIGYVTDADFSPDGQGIITVAEGAIRIWQQQQGQGWVSTSQPDLWQGKKIFNLDAAFLPDGTVATVSNDNILRIWQEDTAGNWKILTQEEDQPLSRIDIPPGGDYFVASAWDGRKLVWRKEPAGRGWVASALLGADYSITPTRFSSNGRRILTLSIANAARIWRQNADGRWAGTLLNVPKIAAVSFSPDGRHVSAVFDDGVVRTLDTRFLASEEDWEKAEPHSRAETICREAMGQELLDPAEEGGRQRPNRYPIRTVTEADALAVPAVRDWIGEDVCAEILDPPPWWRALLFWR